MKDEYGRVNNRKQAIESLDKQRMAMLLDDIVKNLGKYPSSQQEWLSWLDEDSGESIEEF